MLSEKHTKLKKITLRYLPKLLDLDQVSETLLKLKNNNIEYIFFDLKVDFPANYWDNFKPIDCLSIVKR